MDEAREAAVTAYLEKFCWDDWIGRDECGIDFRAGWEAGIAWARAQAQEEGPPAEMFHGCVLDGAWQPVDGAEDR